MIYKATIQQAYKDAGRELSEPALTETYEAMMNQWEKASASNLQMLTDRWKQKTGKQTVDALTRGQLLNLADQQASEEVRSEWLDPLTQEIVEDNLLHDEMNPPSLQVLTSPNLWMTQWNLLPDNDALNELAASLWPEKDSKWLLVATALLQVSDHQNKEYPTEKDSTLLPAFEAKINHAMTLN